MYACMIHVTKYTYINVCMYTHTHTHTHAQHTHTLTFGMYIILLPRGSCGYVYA